jgi:hypothetical protein
LLAAEVEVAVVVLDVVVEVVHEVVVADDSSALSLRRSSFATVVVDLEPDERQTE